MAVEGRLDWLSPPSSDCYFCSERAATHAECHDWADRVSEVNGETTLAHLAMSEVNCSFSEIVLHREIALSSKRYTYINSTKDFTICLTAINLFEPRYTNSRHFVESLCCTKKQGIYFFIPWGSSHYKLSNLFRCNEKILLRWYLDSTVEVQSPGLDDLIPWRFQSLECYYITWLLNSSKQLASMIGPLQPTGVNDWSSSTYWRQWLV